MNFLAAFVANAEGESANAERRAFGKMSPRSLQSHSARCVCLPPIVVDKNQLGDPPVPGGGGVVLLRVLRWVRAAAFLYRVVLPGVCFEVPRYTCAAVERTAS